MSVGFRVIKLVCFRVCRACRIQGCLGFVASGLGWMFSVSEQMGCKGVGGETRGV